MANKLLAVIWDLDGTLADCRHRLHHILASEPDWAAFHEKTLNDTLIVPAAILNRALYEQKIYQFICTARHECARQLTNIWLRQHTIKYYEMHMRLDTDHRPSTEVKLGMLQNIQERGFEILCAFEDQPQCVSMYRNNGVACFAADDRNWRDCVFREANPQRAK